jgi:hypothetical protein
VTPRDEVRLVGGFFLMPIVAGIVGVALFPAILLTGDWLRSTGTFTAPPARYAPPSAAIGFGLGVAMIAVVVTAFGAIPAVSQLKKAGTLSLRRLVVTGAVLGNVPLVLIVLVSTAVQFSKGTTLEEMGQMWYGVLGLVRLTVVGTIVGTISSAVFWLVAVRKSDG